MLRCLLIISLLNSISGHLPDGFTKYPEDSVVTTGQSIDLECMLKRPTDYSLRITVRFLSNMTDKFLNSREVNGQGHYKVATKKKTRVLTILKVNEDTEGDYRCIGVDIVSDEDLVGPYRKLRIAKPPGIQHEDTMTVVESRSLNLSVSFTGLPLPNVTLYRNGTMEAFIPNIDTLQYLLPHVTRSDAGLYTVIASNMAGEAKSEFQVIVRYKPRIMTESTPRKHKISSNVSFSCDVDSNPRSSFKWLHNKTELSSHPNLYSLLNNGQLIVHNIRYNHTGTYTCKASNELGEDRKDFKLIVQVPPGAPGKPKVESYTRTTVQLKWEKGFDGHADITGYRLEYQNETNSWKRFTALRIPTSTTFTVNNLRPNGPYRFRLRAVTSVGHSQWSEPSEEIMTHPLAPLKPLQRGLRNINATSFDVYWNPPYGYKEGDIHGTIIKYKVEWWVTSEGRSTSSYVNVTGIEHHKLLTNLKKGTKYSVVVSAINNAFIGLASKEEEGTTLKTKPAPPSNIQTNPINSRLIRLSWTTTDLGGGAITKIIVEYQTVGGEWKEANQQPNVGDTEVVISDLTEKTQYRMRVTLENEEGRSIPGVSSIVTTPPSGAPTKPKLRATSVGMEEIELTWEKTGTTAVVSWTLQIKREMEEEWRVVEELIHESRKSRVVDELKPNTTYWFRVIVQNNEGSSPFSDFVMVTTKPLEPPPAVSVVTVVKQDTQSESNEVVMTWERGVEGVTGYLVQYRHASDDEWTENEVGLDATSFVVSELQHNSTYYFRVITLQGELRSVPSNVSQLMTTAEEDEGLSPDSPLSVGSVSDESFPLAALIAVCVVGGLVVVLLVVVVIAVYCSKREQLKEKWYDPPEDSTSWCQDDSYRSPGSMPPSSSKTISDAEADAQFEPVKYAELQLFKEPSFRPLHARREETPYADIDIEETVARAERSRSQSAEPAGPSNRRGNHYHLAPPSANVQPESDV